MFMFLKLQHCNCKYYKTLYCIIAFTDEEKKLKLTKKKQYMKNPSQIN